MKSHLTPKTVRKLVEDEFGIDISVSTRDTRYVLARKIYFILSRKYTAYPLASIGGEVGRDHATVLHHTKNADMFHRNYPEAREPMARLTNLLDQLLEPILEVPALRALGEMERLTA